MSTFDKNVINVEGGLTVDPHDKGGITKYGISKREFPHLDILNLTADQALEILRTNYWDICSLDKVNNQTIADIIFLLAVNIGVDSAVKIVQNAINHCLENVFPIKVDGICGNTTIHYINTCQALWLIDSIRLRECQYYLAIVDRDHSQEIYLRGWLHRMFEN